MNSIVQTARKWEFEARIFISLCIVLFVCLLSYGIFDSSFSSFSFIGRACGLSQRFSKTIGFILAALIMALASLLRMWAGSILSSQRVMAFEVQNDALLTHGPYLIVRNPIYFADLLAMCGFALCLPPSGLLLPVLIYVHYLQLVKYEEHSLEDKFGRRFRDYAERVPRLIPSVKSIVAFLGSPRDLRVDRDGFRNNALYFLFIPGLIVSAFTGQFFHAAIIGLPGVLDWAVIHTRKGLPKTGNAKQRNPSRKKVFAGILYAQCWEDPQIDRTAFRINEDDVVFTITSGGCNALTFLLDNPRQIIALDINPYQNYLLELKMAAFRNLTHGEMLEFVGVRHSARRFEMYRRLRDCLSEQSLAYWDGQGEKISQGIIHCGRFESYMRLLRRALRCLVARTTIERVFEVEGSNAREHFYRTHWETIRWKLFTKILLSRRLMTFLFDKAFFQYLGHSFSFGDHFAEQAKYALTRLPSRESYFLSYILLGRYYDEEHLPPYLREENFTIIRNRLDRIKIVTDSCKRFFSTLHGNTITKFNFTNIFEWISADAYESLLRETIRVASDQAVMTYRNLLVFRERPLTLADPIHPWKQLALCLHRRDLSFIYNNYVVEQIHKNGVVWNTVSAKYAAEQQ